MKRGFTLVELLVSIGVIALLASIIVPSYSIVRARANSAAAQSKTAQASAMS